MEVLSSLGIVSFQLLVKHKVVQHKVKVQRPQLLDNIEEDESAVVDTPEEANSDVLEENSDRMASIVIENLAGELPSQFPQSSSESIFVTNTEQIFSDTVTDNELQDRQNEALNVFLEQLQSNNSYRDSVQVQFASESSDGVNDLQSTDNSKIPHHNSETQRNDPTDKGTDLVLNDANIPSEYEPMEEETGPVDILASYKAEIVPTLTLVPQESNRENIISIMNSHVTLIDDNGNHAGILNKGEKSKLADSISVTVDGLTRNTKVSKPELPNSIFDAFQSSNVASEEMLPRSCSENINNSLEEQYQPNENENPHPEATVPNRNNEVPDSVDCMISPAVMEADPVSRELQLSVEQDDVSSAFLELVSTPSFGDTGDQNQDKSTENPEEVEQTLHADLPLPDSFDLDVVSEGTPMLPAENSKSMDVGPPYNCDICNKEFHKADYLYRHLRKHTGEFTCVSCLAVFARKETLLNHSCFADASEEAESSSSLTCPYCQKKFRQKKFFKRHIAKHTGEWKCNKCQKFYSSKATLASHRCIKKSRTTHHCKVCNRQFHRLNYLKKHMLLHVENHPCSTCGKKLQSNEILQTHQLYCSRGKLLETVGETTCPHCNVTFSQLVSYRHHMYQHTYPFICRLCGARFKTESGRILHVCSESMLKCDACLKHFSSVFSLSRHQVVHGIPQFHCYECGLSFHHSDNYTSHICNAREDVNIQLQGEKGSDDTEETENISTVLDEDIDMNRNESSKRKQNLEAATSGSLVCDVCGEVYKTIHILKAHMQLHGELYKCSLWWGIWVFTFFV
ncbi:hypothetical protein ANN_26219 [Periplaneta americana]|uniref:C2H2-type domain-containing protein n=1 Tax=Periplaneta americana TaxID=6978 RepID=A0ABQ8S5X1_PERAM|nr:hypothetical protein ANN_26219 [Periplaneta americana]